MSAEIDVEHVPAGATLELFVSPDCPYCRQARAFYDAAGTPYRAYDAQNDAAHRERMLRYSGGDPTVPAIVVGGRYVQSGWGKPPRG